MPTRNSIIALILLFLTMVVVRIGKIDANGPKTLQNLLDAIATIESHKNDNLIGNGGKTLGRFQIDYQYWLDAKMPYGKWQDCKEQGYAESTIKNHWNGYATDSLRNNDFKRLSWCFHFGKTWREKQNTKEAEKYWEKVKMELDRME